ncbi:MAG: metallophosphoesterase family protein [Terriglobales bacterium]
MKFLQKLPVVILFLGCVACSRSHSQAAGPVEPVELQAPVSTSFHFVAYGDSRFHDPEDTDAANPPVRQALVQAIAQTNPAFVVLTGDIVYNGYDKDDWKVWDSETAIWREKKVPVYPTLGNHDLDSALDETSGPQGQWFKQELDSLPSDVDFVFLVLHHPPYTSSSDKKMYGGGHSSRPEEHELARMLEARQASQRARMVVFSGHVHNYERHEHGGVTYFVSGGAGAHAYPIERAKDDPFQSKEINYHYLQVEVDRGSLKITMHRLDMTSGKEVWTEPDSMTIAAPAAKAATAGK